MDLYLHSLDIDSFYIYICILKIKLVFVDLYMHPSDIDSIFRSYMCTLYIRIAFLDLYWYPLDIDRIFRSIYVPFEYIALNNQPLITVIQNLT